ncbi:hypothetical protein CYY_010101 [Polysphondylium violaceum]|uniref:TLDc domain-containing protein n=1 Tax=Polysphondylium violaceum TaxID=133409 RepID=A0A8J4PK16_9MYCE|nr:hypothetical protein CYY_010101 [Polysphondylium violaceum]
MNLKGRFISQHLFTQYLNYQSYSHKDIQQASETNKFSGSAFHSACDGKGPTITVIETTDGCIFGGYNSQSWNDRGKYYGDNKCFIFTLVNKHGIEPTKYFPETDTYYVGSTPSQGPVFGFEPDGNRDIKILESDPFQSFPSSYNDTTGVGKTTLNPSRYFTIKNLEIYRCN